MFELNQIFIHVWEDRHLKCPVKVFVILILQMCWAMTWAQILKSQPFKSTHLQCIAIVSDIPALENWVCWPLRPLVVWVLIPWARWRQIPQTIKCFFPWSVFSLWLGFQLSQRRQNGEIKAGGEGSLETMKTKRENGNVSLELPVKSFPTCPQSRQSCL